MKIPYQNTIYRSIGDVINYSRKIYDGLSKVVQDSILSLKPYEGFVVGPNGVLSETNYWHELYGARDNGNLYARVNGGSASNVSVTRMIWDGPVKLIVSTSDGNMFTLNSRDGRRGGYKAYVAEYVRENKLDLPKSEINKIIRKLKNPT